MDGDGSRIIAIILVLVISVGVSIYNHFTGNDIDKDAFRSLDTVAQDAIKESPQ